MAGDEKSVDMSAACSNVEEGGGGRGEAPKVEEEAFWRLGSEVGLLSCRWLAFKLPQADPFGFIGVAHS